MGWADMDSHDGASIPSNTSDRTANVEGMASVHMAKVVVMGRRPDSVAGSRPERLRGRFLCI